jgi:toxin ParE1/3/4
MQVRWTRQALLNLEHAVEYISTDSPTVANQVAQKTWNSFQLLREHPRIGRPGRVKGTREMVIPGLPYVVPYMEENGIVFILRILHSSMKWPK